MKTLIELFGSEPLRNFLPALLCRPEKVIFILPGYRNDPPRSFDTVKELIKTRLPDTEVLCRRADVFSMPEVFELLESITAEYEDVFIDVTGGSEPCIAAAGMISQKTGLGILYFDPIKRQLTAVKDGLPSTAIWKDPLITCADMVSATGANIYGTHRGGFDSLDAEMVETANNVFDVIKKDYKRWARFAGYLSKLMSEYGREAEVTGPIRLGGSSCDFGILKQLMQRGVLTYSDDGTDITIRFTHEPSAGLFTDPGAWLEYHVFITAKECGFFSDALISAKIDWDGHTEDFRRADCEIDLMLMRGITPVFISCKMGAPNKDALYEIKLLAERFGGGTARPVLVTGTEPRKQNLTIYKKAKELRIAIIDGEDIAEGNLAELLRKAAEGSYTYKEPVERPSYYEKR